MFLSGPKQSKASWCQRPYTRFQKPSLHEASWNDPKIRIVFQFMFNSTMPQANLKSFKTVEKVWKGNVVWKWETFQTFNASDLGKAFNCCKEFLELWRCTIKFYWSSQLQTDHLGPIRSHVGNGISRCLMLDDVRVWRCMDLYELIEPKNSWFCGVGMMVHPLASHLPGKFVLAGMFPRSFFHLPNGHWQT